MFSWLKTSSGALSKIACAFKSFMNWMREGRLFEAGQDKARSDIAGQKAKEDEENRKIRNRIRTGDDADRAFKRFKEGGNG